MSKSPPRTPLDVDRPSVARTNDSDDVRLILVSPNDLLSRSWWTCRANRGSQLSRPRLESQRVLGCPTGVRPGGAPPTRRTALQWSTGRWDDCADADCQVGAGEAVVGGVG